MSSDLWHCLTCLYCNNDQRGGQCVLCSSSKTVETLQPALFSPVRKATDPKNSQETPSPVNSSKVPTLSNDNLNVSSIPGSNPPSFTCDICEQSDSVLDLFSSRKSMHLSCKSCSTSVHSFCYGITNEEIESKVPFASTLKDAWVCSACNLKKDPRRTIALTRRSSSNSSITNRRVCVICSNHGGGDFMNEVTSLPIQGGRSYKWVHPVCLMSWMREPLAITSNDQIKSGVSHQETGREESEEDFQNFNPTTTTSHNHSLHSFSPTLQSCECPSKDSRLKGECIVCEENGATVSCGFPKCSRKVHYGCAKSVNIPIKVSPEVGRVSMLCFKHSELTQENVHKIKIVLKYGEENVGEITRQELLGSSWAKSEILKLRTQRGSSDDSGANNNQENDATNKNLAISNLLASPDFESTSITSQFIKIISENEKMKSWIKQILKLDDEQFVTPSEHQKEKKKKKKKRKREKKEDNDEEEKEDRNCPSPSPPISLSSPRMTKKKKRRSRRVEEMKEEESISQPQKISLIAHHCFSFLSSTIKFEERSEFESSMRVENERTFDMFTKTNLNTSSSSSPPDDPFYFLPKEPSESSPPTSFIMMSSQKRKPKVSTPTSSSSSSTPPFSSQIYFANQSDESKK